MIASYQTPPVPLWIAERRATSWVPAFAGITHAVENCTMSNENGALPVPHPWIPAQGRNDELRAVLAGHFHANDEVMQKSPCAEMTAGIGQEFGSARAETQGGL